MAAQVRTDQPEPCGLLGEDELPVRADAGEAVQPDQRLTLAADLVIHLHAVDRRRLSGHLTSPPMIRSAGEDAGAPRNVRSIRQPRIPLLSPAFRRQDRLGAITAPRTPPR